MKKMKKILAMFLAMAMVLGMSMTTFAAEGSATITVNGATSATLTYLQVIKEDPSAATGWSFADAEGSTTIADAYLTGFGVTKSTDETVYNTQKQTIIAQLLKNKGADLSNMSDTYKNVTKATATQIQNALNEVCKNASAQFTTLESTTAIQKAGLYVVKATEAGYAYSPMAAFVSNEDIAKGKSVSVTAKRVPIGGPDDNNNTFDKKNGENTTVVAIGEKVDFTIDTIVPFIPENIEKEENGERVVSVYFKVTDEISGAEYVKSGDTVVLQYKIGESGTLTTVAADKITMGDDGKSFTVALDDVVAGNANANQKLQITYSAVVTGEVVTNKASADYGDLKDKDGNDVEDPEDTDRLFTGSITMTKTDDNSDESAREKLAGAKFYVYFEGGTIDENGQITAYENGTNKCYAVFAEGTNKVERWTSNKAEATMTTATSAEEGDAKGTVVVTGLKYGVAYKFEEAEAPAGYSLNAAPVSATWLTSSKPEIPAQNKNESEADYQTRLVSEYQSKLKDDISMTDTTLASLPSTGGIGTTIFTVGGCAIMIIAAGLYFASRRRAAK